MPGDGIVDTAAIPNFVNIGDAVGNGVNESGASASQSLVTSGILAFMEQSSLAIVKNPVISIPLLLVLSIGFTLAYDALSSRPVPGKKVVPSDVKLSSSTSSMLGSTTPKPQETNWFRSKWDKASTTVAEYLSKVDPSWYAKPVLIKAGTGLLAGGVFAILCAKEILAVEQIALVGGALSIVAVGAFLARFGKVGIKKLQTYWVARVEESKKQAAAAAVDPKVTNLRKQIDDNEKRIKALEQEIETYDTTLTALKFAYDQYKLTKTAGLKLSHDNYEEYTGKKAKAEEEIAQLTRKNTQLEQDLDTVADEVVKKLKEQKAFVKSQRKRGSRGEDSSPPTSPKKGDGIVNVDPKVQQGLAPFDFRQVDLNSPSPEGGSPDDSGSEGTNDTDTTDGSL